MYTMKNIYQENGYKDRKDYLNSMAEEFDVPITVVLKWQSQKSHWL